MNGDIQCRRCGDPNENFAPKGNATIDNAGIYVSAQCPACQTWGPQHLINQLNRERCPCEGLGNVEILAGVVTGKACPRCMTMPTEETLQRVRELIA